MIARAVKTVRRLSCWHEIILTVLLVVLLCAASQVMPNFLNPRGQLILSKHLWETAIVAIPMTLIILTGGIDLSVGSTMGLCAVAFGLCFHATANLPLSCATCALTGLACGAVNGMLVARLRVHPLIITLATYAVYRGMAEGLSQGSSYSQFGSTYSMLARGTIAGVPYPALLFLALAILTGVGLTKSAHGRFIYAIGHNEQAARFSGIPVERLKGILYTASGLLAGLATLIYISRFDTAKADAGMGIELDVITAVVIGGTSIFGGRGNMVGTVLGLLLIHESKLFVGRYWQIEELKSIFVGLLLIVSVLLHRVVSPTDRE